MEGRQLMGTLSLWRYRRQRFKPADRWWSLVIGRIFENTQGRNPGKPVSQESALILFSSVKHQTFAFRHRPKQFKSKITGTLSCASYLM
jgi:hypothetical protein